MKGQVLRVHFEGRAFALVSGYGSREMLTELRGRAPMWSTIRKAWTTTPKTARDLIAMAEARGRRVVISDADQLELLGGDAT
ncbi:hypothetical protein [Nocardioides sp. Kera G14]|uniref:hypothetical protein n=1 Tax=Nocardioides sp. Kera G14 TaxID=2884264 RepID=UPI001D0FBD53|nr:hypothetical protein [Nocardioides sp. Kera G14]UDY22398.1 hypothetical protein LH076_09930 [Nocardioides sp. Kera G14]